jgi:hypothetical protein
MGEKKRNSAQIALLAEECFKLRLQGMDYFAIGRQLGISNIYALTLINKRLASMPTENVEEVRRIETLKLDRLEARLTGEMALNPELTKDQAELQLKIAARRASLLGLDAPMKVAIQQSISVEQLGQLSDEQLLQLSSVVKNLTVVNNTLLNGKIVKAEDVVRIQALE